MSYVGPPLRYNGGKERMKRLASSLYSSHPRSKDADVIFFQELEYHDSEVLNRLTHQPYHTPAVYSSLYSSLPRFMGSGLRIASKTPITRSADHVFTCDTYNFEKLVAKAVVYAQIGQIHVFNTHLCAWPGHEAVRIRNQQFVQLTDFIQRQQIPRTEYVFVGGDLNISAYEFPSISKQLASEMDIYFPIPRFPVFSVDPQSNTLTGNDAIGEYQIVGSDTTLQEMMAYYRKIGRCLQAPSQLLDCVGYHQNYAKPTWISTEVIHCKSKYPFALRYSLLDTRLSRDISDHYPVITHWNCPGIRFGGRDDSVVKDLNFKDVNIECSRIHVKGINTSPYVILMHLVIGIFVFIVLLSLYASIRIIVMRSHGWAAGGHVGGAGN